MDQTDSTTADLAHAPRGAVGQWAHRSGIAVVALIVVAGLVGLMGPRSTTVSVTSEGWTLEVEHATLTRSGQPAPLHVRVERPGGFTGPVQLSLCDDLFDHLDFQNWYPNPSAETSARPWVLYEFDPPPAAETLEISLDARTAPGQFGEVDDCEVVLLEDDTAVVSTSFTVWRMP